MSHHSFCMISHQLTGRRQDWSPDSSTIRILVKYWSTIFRDFFKRVDIGNGDARNGKSTDLTNDYLLHHRIICQCRWYDFKILRFSECSPQRRFCPQHKRGRNEQFYPFFSHKRLWHIWQNLSLVLPHQYLWCRERLCRSKSSTPLTQISNHVHTIESWLEILK